MSTLENRKRELEQELSEIREREKQERSAEKFKETVDFMDNIDVFLKFIDHNRTSCSDKDRTNAYTTSGRGGAFRCNRCAMLEAKDSWELHRDWLIENEDLGDIHTMIGLYFNGIDVFVNTNAE